MKANGQKYVASTVAVDDTIFDGCTFENCVLTYSGGEPPSFTRCSFADSRFVFDGPAARTVALLKALSSPKSGLQKLVADTFPALGGH